ncbi:MAG TPA: HAD family hydrolase [Actinomycetota bacterium]|nr:HAD family hydrolase [Actinomycetota bacterium]
MGERWATFDCYGTLVDWFGGVRDTLGRLFGHAAGDDALLEAYMRIEPGVQRGRGISYREVMAETMAEMAGDLGITIPAGEADALARSLPSWRVFPEVLSALTALRETGWKLAILSNTDLDLLEASIATIGVEIDERVVASDIGSYKPSFGHWETFFRRTGAERPRHVHVAASLFHDIEPCAKLGLPAVWIDRLGETSMVPRSATLPDLVELPETLERLVPS